MDSDTRTSRSDLGSPNEKGEPKQERARHTRAHILHMAAELFAEHGYSSVTLQDVAERAGMTKGAVYFHYKNREALASAVVHGLYARWQPILAEATAADGPPLQQLFALLEQVAVSFENDTVVQAGARLQIERSLINAELPEPFVGWLATLEPLVTKARAAGQLRADVNAEELTYVLVSATFGMQHMCDILGQRDQLVKRQRYLRELLFTGLTKG